MTDMVVSFTDQLVNIRYFSQTLEDQALSGYSLVSKVHFAEPLHDLHVYPSPWLIWSWAIRQWWGGWGTRLAGNHRTGHIIHLITKFVLCWFHSLVSLHLGHRYFLSFSLSFCSFREVYAYTDFLIPKFPIMSFQSPQPSCLIIRHGVWIGVHSYLWPFLLPSKMNSQVHRLRFCPLEDFPSPLSFGDLPERGFSAAAAPFWVVPTNHTKLSISQTQVFSSSISWLYGAPHEIICARKEREGNVARVGGHGHLDYLLM